MINRPGLPGFQRFPLNNNAVVPPAVSTACDWRLNSDDELRRLRSNYVVVIERMLRNHQPHDVLNHVPENTDWRSKTFKLALKIERLMFKAAKSRADYLDEHTLHHRVKILCRYLVRIRMRKNAMVEGVPKRC
ncbi:hypothetical protein PHYSODRAFT_251028 [Phytophthora sojae]|uniref:Uncharacterized protein n=1 Tax=Phytophthora sojae (strain P6497) TaxID=1094619 RepID=G4ZNU8_PHYSP|nr:hypothetical protein PHYSODRAFT_251028 [Phytophthora sojae]EGZ15416.1 hypothetical protein PHYSODRAFT_251028 [Phytophthora sojae]|eukprot:XP_009529165.1 hypothetical protein PHYSODRAFT_251028 [Phytophthora sojae]